MRTHIMSAALALAVLAPSAHAQQSGAAQEGFAANAAQSSTAEILISNLALAKSESPQVENFAEMMISEHTHTNKTLARLAQENDITLPAIPSQEQMQTIQRLQTLSGEEFDQAYLQHQLQSHQKSISLFQQGAQSAQSEELQRFAKMHLPLLQAHHQVAQQIASELGVSTAEGGTASTDR